MSADQVPPRERRLHSPSDSPNNPDERSRFERDRDRIIYTSAFRRLSGITQVASGEGTYDLHNRLTHVLEVAQIGRRLAQRLANKAASDDPAEQINADVVEAACLAHDLGHPPFGHVAEEELSDLANEGGAGDRFEGNAQSFRVITRLATRRADAPGLDLTAATLTAVMKYPWVRESTGYESRKYGVYKESNEKKDFDWARQQLNLAPRRRTAEAEIMDLADDIAYAIHDMEDFYKYGKIPLERLRNDERELDRFFRDAFLAWDLHELNPNEDREKCRAAFAQLLKLLPVTPYDGTAQSRGVLRGLTSYLIGQYVNAVELSAPHKPDDPIIAIDPQFRREIKMLKELTWVYVIRDPALATHQHGQREIIRELFRILLAAAADKRKWDVLPQWARDELQTHDKAQARTREAAQTRLVVDLIAGMAEPQAVELYHRLKGLARPSPLVRVLT